MNGYKTEPERALEVEREELLVLFKEREELEIRIAKKQRRVAALATLVDDSEASDSILGLDLYGLTNAIRTALKSGVPLGLTASEIKARLAELCFPVNEYTNFRASLNVVLRRLLEAGEIKEVHVTTIEHGNRREDKVFQWVQKYGAANSLANTFLKDRRR